MNDPRASAAVPALVSSTAQILAFIASAEIPHGMWPGAITMICEMTRTATDPTALITTLGCVPSVRPETVRRDVT